MFNVTDSVVISGGPQGITGEYIEHGQSDGVAMYRRLRSPGRHRGMKAWMDWHVYGILDTFINCFGPHLL